MCRTADVHRRRALRVVLGTVDVGPGGGVQDEIRRRAEGRRGHGHVPVGTRQRQDLVGGESLDQRVAELSARAGQDDATASRGDRIGVSMLHRSATRGSFHGISCSSGSSGSYSSVTW